MDRIIRQITEHFLSQLPGDEEYYSIEELKDYDFPAFLVRRIHIELQWNLDESMILPKTDWANTSSDAVQESWQQFLNAIHAEVQLPASYAKAVIETAVTDIIDMLMQPRKNIPDILFGGEDVLSADEMEERTELLVVYPHFAQVLTSYMKRKDKTELSRERCKKIINKVDQKVTHQYTPLQWAQMLDPLFTLAGPELDSNLLRLFFEDREMPRTAERFDEIDESITRAEFIEVLSAPEMLNYDSYDDELKTEVDPSSQKDAETVTEPGEAQPEEQASTDIERPDEVESLSEDKSKEDEPDFEPAEPEEQTDINEEPEVEEDEKIEPEPDFEVQSKLSEEKTIRPEPDEEGQSNSLNDIFTSDTVEDEEDSEETFDSPPADENSPTVNIETEEEESEDEESPIWMRFMDSDDYEEPEDETELPDQENEEYLDEPVIDLRESKEKDIKDLEKVLEDDRDYFINNLFDGSDRAYRDALQEIAEKDSWKDASKLIGRIFDRNMVNLYSEAAVDFTDRMHNYFIYKENGN